MPALNLVGQQYGKLTVIQRNGSNDKRQALWLCECECGGTSTVPTAQLRNGNTQSCGCMSGTREKVGNAYIDMGDHLVGIDSKGNEFMIDHEDHSLVSEYTWFVEESGYVYARLCPNSGKTALHRFLLEITDTHVWVDHRNHNKSDNTRQNIRVATPTENNMNRSNVKGVYYDPKRDKWQARIRFQGRNLSLGRFKTEEEALAVRKQAEQEYFGEFACSE